MFLFIGKDNFLSDAARDGFNAAREGVEGDFFAPELKMSLTPLA